MPRLRCDDCGLTKKRRGPKGRYRVTVVAVDYEPEQAQHAGSWAEWNLCEHCLAARMALGYLKVEYLGPPDATLAPRSGNSSQGEGNG